MILENFNGILLDYSKWHFGYAICYETTEQT